MQNEKFEDHIKELLYDHQEAAPNVMNKVFEKRTPLYVFKNRLLLHKYKLVAAGLVIGVIALFLGLTNPFDREQNAEDQNQPQKELVQNDITSSTDKGIVAPKVESDNQQPSTLIVEDPIDNTTDNSIDQERISYIPEVNNDNNINQHSQSDDAAQNNTDVDKTNQLKDMLAKLKSEKSKGNDVGEGATKSDYPNLETGSIKSGDIQQDNKPEVDEVVSAEKEVQEENAVDETMEMVKPADETNKKPIDTENSIVKNTDSKSGSEVDASIGDEDFGLPKTKQRKLSLSYSTFVGMGSRKLDGGSDLATTIVRDNTETNKLSLGGELLLNYKLHDNVDAFIGMGYFNRREAMVYQTNAQVTDVDITSKKVIEHHPVFGTREITVYDTTYNTRDVQTNGDAKNSYKHLYVPVGLRVTLYDKKFGVHMSVNGGIEVMTKTSGTILNNQYQEVSLGKDFSRTSVGGMVGAGIGFSFIVHERINVLTELRGNFFLDPTNNPDYPVRQLDLGYGLMVGLKYDLK